MESGGTKENQNKGMILNRAEESLGDLSFASILENMDEGVIIADRHGQIRYINERASLYMGKVERDVDVEDRNHALGIYDPESFSLMEPRELPLKKAIDGIETYNKILYIQNNSLPDGVYLKANGKPVYDANGYLAGGMVSFFDVTAQIRNQKQEKKKKDFYLSLINHMSEGLAQFDSEGRLQTVNASLQRMLGYTEDELVGGKVYELELFDKEDYQKLQQKEEESKAGKSDHFVQKVKTSDGSNIHFYVIAQPIFDEDGNYQGSIAILSDISEQIETEEKLKESEKNYRNLVERMNEGVFYTDTDGNVQFVNERFKMLTGLDEAQLQGQNLKEALDIRNFSDEDFYEKLASRLRGEPEVYDILFTNNKGKDKWLRVSASPVKGEDDQILGVMGLFSDITTEKQTAEENKRLRALVESTPDYIGIGDREGRPVFLNKASQQKLRLDDEDDLNSINIYDRLSYQDPSVYTDQIVPALKEKGSWQGEVTLVDMDGRWIRVSQVVLAEKDGDGRIQYIYVVARDISETRNLARIAELSPGPILRVTPKSKIEYANQSSNSLLEKWNTQLEGELPKVWQKVITKCLDEGRVREYEVTCDNTIYDLKVVPILDQSIVNIIGTDITKRKRIEKLLRQSEEKYRAVVEDQTEMICRFMPDGTITFANEAYCRYFQQDRHEIIGTNLIEQFEEHERETFLEHIGQLTKGNPVSSYERSYVDLNGQIRWQLWMNRAIFDSFGNFTEYQSVGRDITQFKNTQQAVDRQKSFLRDVIDANPNTIYVTDEDGRVTLVNKAFENEYEVKRDEVENKDISDIVNRKWYYATKEKDEDRLQKESPVIRDEDFLIDRITGEKRWYYTIKSPVLAQEEGESQKMLTIAIDITERKEAEEALRNQLKLEEIISYISLDFINVELAHIDHSVHEALRSICEETGLDFAFITELRDDNLHVMQWYKKGSNDDPFAPFRNHDKSLSQFQWLNDQIEKRGLVYIPSVNHLPSEAKEEKQHFGRLGIHSLVTIPLYTANQFAGFLTFASTQHSRQWSEESLTLFRILGQVFSNALERKNTESLLNHKVEFENLITQISTDFITISIDEIDAAINEALRKVADMLGIEMGIMFTYNQDESTFSLSHRYHKARENFNPAPYLNLSLHDFTSTYKKLKKGEFIAYQDVEEIPDEEANEFDLAKSLDIQSFIILPVQFQNHIIGSLVFGSTEKQVFWSEASRPLLNIVSQIFANALKRQQTEFSLRESQELYCTLASNIPHSTVFLFDEDLEYYVVEGASLDAIGLANDQVTGKTLEKVFSKDLVDKLKPLHKKALDGEENVIEHRFHNNNHYFIHLLPVKSERSEVFAGMLIFLDVSELKNAQLELERQTEELKRSNSELEMFAYAASHDLREPLRMVNSYVKLIQQRLGDTANQDLHEFMDFAMDGVKRMQGLINDLLDYSRVDRKGKPFTNVEGRQVIEVAKKNLEQLISETRATIHIDELPTIQVDQSQFVSLFQNLINNAIKFRKDEPLEINISAKSQGYQWLFSVTDNGMGIEKTHFERIFNIFQRLHSRQDYEGTGVGLAICKKIVERHGGEMWVSSDVGRGTTFYFTINKEP